MGGEWTAAGEKLFTALNPATCESLLPSFHEATDAEVDRALQLADQAVDALQTLPRETMASFLEEIAIGLETAREVLIARAHAETALPVQRLEAECARTVGHCRSFAQMVRASSWSQPRIDHGNPPSSISRETRIAHTVGRCGARGGVWGQQFSLGYFRSGNGHHFRFRGEVPRGCKGPSSPPRDV